MAEMDCTCAHCGAAFVAKQKNKIYCSRLCNLKAFHARDPGRMKVFRDRERAKAESQPKFSKVFYGTCSDCGSRFFWRRARKRCEACTIAAQKYVSASVHEDRICPCCGLKFVSRTLASTYCSLKCSRRMARRSSPSKHRERARKHGVSYAPVSPAKVFDRDGWRCQICGKQTPKQRRGSRYSNAPELDHRVPISKGGAHDYANTQCACRACNGAKSNKVVVGQLSMEW